MPVNRDLEAGSKMVTTMAPYQVAPQPDEWSRPYWDGAKHGKLVIQRCQSCGHYNHPPHFICAGCRDRDARLAFEEVSGRGSVYSWFVFHDTFIGGFLEKVPYLIAAIELDEQPRLLLHSNILNCPFDKVEMGMPVEVVFEDAGDGVFIPQFQPVQR